MRQLGDGLMAMQMTRESALRSDAARNRERILVAARELFAVHGLDVSMRQIAKTAGVGEPTLRRRFGSKEHLVAEAYADKVGVYADLAEAAAKHSDPAAALRQFLDEVTHMQLSDRGFADVLTMTFPDSLECERQRLRSSAAIDCLVSRAQAHRVLREDFVAADIVLLLLAHAGVAGGAGDVASDFSARLRAYMYGSFGLPVSSSLPPLPDQSQVYQALMRLHVGMPVVEQPVTDPDPSPFTLLSSTDGIGVCNLDGECN